MSTKPSPLPAFSRNSNAFSNGASLVCLLAPVLAGVLGLGFHFASHILTGRNLTIGGFAFGAVSCLLLGAGPILGILALLLMKPGGRSRVVVCSLGGIVLTSGLVAIAVPKYVQARTTALLQNVDLDKLITSNKNFQVKVVTTLNTNGLSPQPARPSPATNAAAKATPSDEELALKGSQAYLARLQELQQAYQAASSNLTAARVLSTSNLTTREDVQERKAAVQNFLKCNEAVKDFSIHSEDNYRAELVRLNLSPAFIESAVEGFHRSSAPQLPVVVEIRAQDERIGAGILAVLDLLDANWGHWNYNQESGHLRFESQDLVEQYNTDLKGINEARIEQVASQKRLATVMGQAAMR